ncbi:hypothetical protein N7474_006181 [Penicillium riverlandense]|uniref:uncharacterized protein n=1 Tax=Penicillium riverlandense TaxID=1903569 RepID=UPI002546C6AE|nr:uncharacterized protein N7474_006181 [Penicillium riverlandense]KAJ5820590.1 hypothetical protein N7474_006181 [Penicillium riverlandense]
MVRIFVATRSKYSVSNIQRRFYIDLATGKSQWEKPQAHAGNPAPPDAPPSYDASSADPAAVASAGDKKQSAMLSNNPYNKPGGRSSQSPSMIDEDARLAAKLQAEEDARASGARGSNTPGASSDYYNEPPQPLGSSAGPSSSQSPGPMPEQKRSRGFLGKLMGKSSSSSSRPPPPQPQYGSYGPPPQQGPPPGGYYGGYPPQPQPGYGYPPGPGYGYPPQGGYYPQQQPPRKSGMGTAGAAALGVGGGLLGGMLLADAVEDMGDHNDYGNGGYDNGGYGDNGGDYGGGGDDFGGGDM